ncbi:HbrB-like-domain-containing protein [Coprinopsis sp. MPI-PUGE-AT-0042]|nr:HbrB-like-domain-containing protein [Coprinopsis sp. MPI-PUGE-AT-0042]
MWSSTYSSRRSHEQSGETKQSRSSSPGESQESHRRTSSEATPRPTPANPRFLSASTDQDVSKSFMSTTPAEVFTSSSKRIGGFLAEKLSSSLSGTGSSHRNQSQLHVPNNHTRGDSSASTMTSLSLSPVPMASSTSINSTKTHTSPSKASYGRTYDSKVVTREMHRLGNFSQLSGALAPQLSTAPSASSLSLPTPGSASQVSLTSTATADPWETLHVYVLPLFNGEAFKIPIEDLNGLVKRHIQTVVSSSPSRALVKLEGDASELIANGMLTLNSKLIDIDEEKLLARIVETWGFFWDQILPYLEGVLLPLQTEPLLSTLSRPKPVHRGTSPSRSGQTSSSQLSTGTPSIDVRTLALRSFRDKVVYPLFPRLFARLNVPGRHDVFEDKAGYQQPRLQQMLLVLSAQSRRRPVTLSLTAPAPQPTPGEAAITDLLLLVRSPHPLSINRTQAFTLKPSGTHSRTPSFLSGGKPRDRRGRIGKRHGALSPGQLHFSEEDLGDDTPRVGMSVAASYMQESDREKDRELLESLRSVVMFSVPLYLNSCLGKALTMLIPEG